MTLLYVAEPIDRGVDVGRCSEKMLTALAELNADVVAYLPWGAFLVGEHGDPDPRVEEINRAALERADVLVAFLPDDTPTIGVPREIEAFARTGRPWAVVTDVRSYSLLDATVRFHPYEVGSLAFWVAHQQPAPSPVTGGVLPLLFSKSGAHDGTLPTRAYAGDAGYDLYAAEDVHIPYGAFRDVDSGVRVILPAGVHARIVGRSSTMRKRDLLVTEGIIDTGYRGGLYIGVRNLAERGVDVRRGERLAQLILLPNMATQYKPEWVSAATFESAPHDGRGSAGFGSSGS